MVLLGRFDICTNVEQLQRWRRGAAQPVDERRHATTAQTARADVLRATMEKSRARHAESRVDKSEK